MFNRLITRIKEVDKGRGTPPTSPSRAVSGSEDGQEATAEGFLCPSCMEEFASPEELQVHYEESHADGEQRHICPVCKSAFPTTDQLQIHYTSDHALAATANRGDFQTLQQEVAELQTSLKEEKWYSEELKKEVSRLATTGSAARDGDSEVRGQLTASEEIMMWKQQIRALEESKSLLASEIMLLRKQLGEAVETYSSVKLQKDQIEQKAASLAGEKVDLQAMLDEEKGVRKSAEAKLIELQDMKHNLEVQLQQRPEADDVRVLRQELVQVQTLMDRMTRDREAERDKLEQDNESLRFEIEQLRQSVAQRDDELRRAPTTGEIESIQLMLTEKEDELETLNRELQEERLAKTGLSELKIQLTAALDNKDRELKEQVEANSQQQKVNTKLESNFASLTHAIQQKEQEYEKLAQDLSEVQKTLQTKERDYVGLRNTSTAQFTASSEAVGLKNKEISELNLRVEELVIQVEEKQNRSDDIEKMLTALQAQLQAESTASDELKSQLRETQSDLEKEKRSKIQSEEKTFVLENRISQHSDTIERLEKERNDLYGKIEEGEGANTAIQQLQQEKDVLLENLSRQESVSSQQTETLSKKCDDLHNRLQEVSSQLQASYEKVSKMENRCQDMESEILASKEKCQRLEESLKKKVELLKSCETTSGQQKVDYENQLQSLRNSLDNCKGELDKSASKSNHIAEELARVHVEKKSADEQLKKEISNSTALTASVEGLRAEIQKKQGEIATHQAALPIVENEVSRLKEELSKRQCDYMEQLKNVENLNASQQQEILRLNENKMQLEAVSKRTRSGFSVKCSALLSQVQDLKQTLLSTKEEFMALERHTKDEMKSVISNVSDLQLCLIDAQRTLSEKTESHLHLLSKIEHLEKDESALKSTLLEFKAKSKEQEEEIEKQKKIQSVWKKKLDEKEESFKAAQTTLENLHKETAELKNRNIGLETDLSKLQVSLESATKNLKDSQALLSNEQVKSLELLSQQQKLISDLEDSNNLQSHLKEQMENSEQLKKDLELTINSLTLQLASTAENLNELNVQKSSVETELFDTRKGLSDCEEKIASLESSLVEQKNQFNVQQDHDKRKIAELQEAKELLIAQKLDIQNRLSSVDDQLKQELINHGNTKEIAKQTAEAQQQKIEEYSSQISILKESKISIEQTAEQQKARSEMERNTMLENLRTLKDDLIGHEEKLNKIQARNDELSGEKLELEAKLENALDERRALLERCLNSESEWDKLKGLTVELRRKLDDALSALHELGRENQTLQMEATKLTSRKWANDAEVDSCSACQKLFSVTVRKHHCRNCGNIYCNECSARSATVAASKKPVRVCDSCYNELSNNLRLA